MMPAMARAGRMPRLLSQTTLSKTFDAALRIRAMGRTPQASQDVSMTEDEKLRSTLGVTPAPRSEQAPFSIAKPTPALPRSIVIPSAPWSENVTVAVPPSGVDQRSTLALPNAPARALLPLPTYAAVSAAFSVGARRRASILEEHDVSESHFTEADELWTERIVQQLDRGKASLRDRFDKLFVQAWCAERARADQPFEEEDARRCREAEACGELAIRLSEYGISRAQWLRLRRVFVRR